MRRLAISLPFLAVLVFSACGGSTSAGSESEIAFVTSRDGHYTIYGMRADGSGEGRLSDGESGAGDTASAFFEVGPAWSPDGTQIAFASWRDGRSHIYVMRADGTGTTRLTSGKLPDSNPTWSPDGRRIAFERNAMIYVMTSDGGHVRRVTRSVGGEEGDPAWSPDGRWLAYVRRESGFDKREIWRVRPDGSGNTRVTRLNAQSFTPAWSKDSRRIVLSSNVNDGRYQLYEVTARGKGLRRLTFQPGEYFDPSWSPDGATLVFERDGIVYARNKDGLESALTDGPNDGSPAWRPARPVP